MKTRALAALAAAARSEWPAQLRVSCVGHPIGRGGGRGAAPRLSSAWANNSASFGSFPARAGSAGSACRRRSAAGRQAFARQDQPEIAGRARRSAEEAKAGPRLLWRRPRRSSVTLPNLLSMTPAVSSSAPSCIRAAVRVTAAARLFAAGTIDFELGDRLFVGPVQRNTSLRPPGMPEDLVSLCFILMNQMLADGERRRRAVSHRSSPPLARARSQLDPATGPRAQMPRMASSASATT